MQRDSTSLTGLAPGERMKKMGVIDDESEKAASRTPMELSAESQLTKSPPLGRV